MDTEVGGATEYTVGIVEDHELIVLGFESMIGSHGNLNYLGHASSVAGLLAVGTPDVAVLDLLLADDSTPTKNVATLHAAGTRVLVYTGSCDTDPYLAREAARAGVWAILPKTADAVELAAAVLATAQGRPVVTTEWAAAIDSDPEFTRAGLSPRQLEVLEYYASGETTSRVATLTGLSRKTVEDYVDRIKAKYAADGRPAGSKLALYQRALEDGFLPHPRPPDVAQRRAE